MLTESKIIVAYISTFYPRNGCTWTYKAACWHGRQSTVLTMSHPTHQRKTPPSQPLSLSRNSLYSFLCIETGIQNLTLWAPWLGICASVTLDIRFHAPEESQGIRQLPPILLGWDWLNSGGSNWTLLQEDLTWRGYCSHSSYYWFPSATKLLYSWRTL